MADRGPDKGAKARRWILPIAAYFVLQIFLTNWITHRFDSFMRSLTEIGGYGLSNATVGLAVGTVCFIGYKFRERNLHNEQANGDPDPLPSPYSYVTQAQPNLWMCWIIGAALWGIGIAMWFAWYPAAWVAFPIFGTTMIALGRLEMAHARVMDAHRGQNSDGAASTM